MSEVSLPSPGVVQYCRNITRRRARNFYYGLKLLPEPRRTALYAVYAWMRKADDLVDNDSLSDEQKRAQLAAFRAATDSALAGKVHNGDPLWEGLWFVSRQYQIKPEHLHAMLDGQLDDVREREFATFESLRQYCYKVASTVGLLCIEIWGYRDPAAPELAIERGIAFQLTNILRDLREDCENGRVYLPQDELAEHGLTPRDLCNWAFPERCRAFLDAQIERAESFYRSSGELDGMIEPQCRPTLWAMTRIYRGLLEKMKANPAQIFGPQRVRLSALHKAKIAVQARWLLKDSGPVEARTT